MVKPSNRGSKKAQSSAARLAAVQAVYQMDGNAQTAPSVVREFVDFRLGEPVDEQAMVTPDRESFTRIVSGVAERRDDLDHMIAATLGRERPPEPLIRAILLCGAWELLAHGDIDAPVIVSDYLHVTDAFYDVGEKKLVNGVLDRIATNLRS